MPKWVVPASRYFDSFHHRNFSLLNTNVIKKGGIDNFVIFLGTFRELIKKYGRDRTILRISRK